MAACRKELLTKLHLNIDRLIDANEYHIDAAIHRWDSKAAWRRISNCIELDFIDGLEVDEATAKKMKRARLTQVCSRKAARARGRGD